MTPNTLQNRYLLRTPLQRLSAVLALCASPLLHAQSAPPPPEPTWRFSGFGTLGAGYHGTDGVQVRRDLDQARGYEGDRLGFRADTRLGVQATARFGPAWGVTVQGLSRLSRDNDWTPEVTWAFVRHSPTDWLDLRVGRLGVDIYPSGDSRHVGYAFTAARPAPEVYGMATDDRFDGADVTLSQPVGSGIASFKVYGGRGRGGYYLYGQSLANDSPVTVGANAQWSSEALTLKAAWGSTYTARDPSLQPLANALRQVPAVVSPMAGVRAAEIGISHHVNFASLGLLYDHGPLTVESTLGWERFTAFPRYEGWAGTVLAAWRIGAWKPYVGYARNRFTPDDKPLALPALNPQLVMLQSVYDRVVDRLRIDQRTVTLGARYDFGGNYALKFQVDHTDAAASTLFTDSAGMPVSDVSTTLYSVVLDFVF